MNRLDQPIPPPEEIRLRKASARLELRWPDGSVGSVSFAALRAACACSACTHARRTGGDLAAGAAVAIDDLQPMGVSGLQIFFSDGHSRGHYPWRYLRELTEVAA